MILDAFHAPKIPLKNFFCADHPEVYLIPQKDYFSVIDDFGDPIGFLQLPMYFSSFNFYVDLPGEDGIFSTLYHDPRFHRLGGISQLGYLCSSKPKNSSEETRIFYYLPQFPHTRWGHSLLTGILAELVLARNGFSKTERDPFVLTAACHDIAMPAGGDSVIRVDPKNLSEENNFRLVMEKDGLAARWAKQFGFDISKASNWVHNIGPHGKLLDAIDKIAYTAHDACYYALYTQGGRVYQHCCQHRFVMDVWQDIRFDGKDVWFTCANRLFDFLLLRAYMHCDIYLNPRSRALDYVIYNQVRKHYAPEMRDQLLSWDDKQLQLWLEQKGEDNGILSPDDLLWKKFESQEEANNFAGRVQKLSHIDHVKQFKTGLDWLVANGKKRTQLRFVLSKSKVVQLESLSKRHASWYVYYYAGAL
ncbi:MAG: HD domain-containing protein [Candidatus Moraniibacteriota bacterium]